MLKPFKKFMEVNKIPKNATKVQTSLDDVARKIESNMARSQKENPDRESSSYKVSIEHHPHSPDQDSPKDRYHIFISATSKKPKGKKDKVDLDPVILTPHEFIKRTLSVHGKDPEKYSAITHDSKNPKNFTIRTWG